MTDRFATTPDGTLIVFAHRDEAQAFIDVPHLVTGIGIVNAMTGLASALRSTDVERVVVLGTAGLIDDTLNLDTVYRVGATVQHDFEFTSPLASIDEAGRVRLSGELRGAYTSTIAAESDTDHVAAEQGITIATGDSFVTDDALKSQLQLAGVHLVDMESHGYAAICAVLEVPLHLYKVPSDFADSSTTGQTWDEIVLRKSEQLLHFARSNELL